MLHIKRTKALLCLRKNIMINMTKVKIKSTDHCDPTRGISSVQRGRIPEKVKRYKSTLESKSLIKEKQEDALKDPTSYFKMRNLSYLCATGKLLAKEENINGSLPQNSDQRSQLSSVVVALDCEMVECEGGKRTAARCSIVDYFGNVLLDVYIRPPYQITNFHTRYSGITKDLMDECRSVDFRTGQNMIKKIIYGKIVIGHSLDFDFKALEFSHPKDFKVDISKEEDLRTLIPDATGNSVSLKRMSLRLLNRRIQIGPHCSVEDAKATMDLFRIVGQKWSDKNEHLLSKCQDMSRCYMDDEFWPDEIKNE